MAKVMNLKNETIRGNMGTLYAEVLGKRVELANIKKFEAKMDINLFKQSVLGMTAKQSKPTGWEGTWTADLHYNTSVFRELAEMFEETGEMPTFTIQTINEDPASVKKIGRQSITFTDCFSDSIILAKLDVDAESLDDSVGGTFNGFKINERFKN